MEHFYLKVDVVLDGGTFYIIFTDKCDLPFPLRIENHSQVPVYVHQAHTLEEKYTMQLRPNGHVLNYSWDEPINERRLIVGVKGGTSSLFDLTDSASTVTLTAKDTAKYLFYENYIYIAFTSSTEPLAQLASSREANFQLSQLELVLTCLNNKVYLDYKESGNRAQLWTLTLDGYLMHEGSSPPRELDMDAGVEMANCYVLDIEEVAPRPGHLIALSVRRPDMRRKSTQRWTFDSNGYLCCNVKNMCLQVHGELRRMAKVVLGPINDLNPKSR
jgi:hypothetical protein